MIEISKLTKEEKKELAKNILDDLRKDNENVVFKTVPDDGMYHEKIYFKKDNVLKRFKRVGMFLLLLILTPLILVFFIVVTFMYLLTGSKFGYIYILDLLEEYLNIMEQ